MRKLPVDESESDSVDVVDPSSESMFLKIEGGVCDARREKLIVHESGFKFRRQKSIVHESQDVSQDVIRVNGQLSVFCQSFVFHKTLSG